MSVKYSHNVAIDTFDNLVPFAIPDVKDDAHEKLK